MPARKDISKILVIGSGPIVIGQACEFDYSGSQACKALKNEGYQVVLINSNPATIMTDPEFADKTYIEPIDKEIVKKIIEQENKLKPLGDSKIAELLNEKGITIARRTIAKYREELNYPVARLRKELK